MSTITNVICYFSPQGRGEGAQEWTWWESQWCLVEDGGGTRVLRSCSQWRRLLRPPGWGTVSQEPTSTYAASLLIPRTKTSSCSAKSEYINILLSDVWSSILNLRNCARIPNNFAGYRIFGKIVNIEIFSKIK